MKRIQLLLVVLIFTLSLGLSAQNVISLSNSADEICGFPDKGVVKSWTTKGIKKRRKKAKGGVMAFKINDQKVFYYHSGGNGSNKKNFKSIINEIKGGHSIVDDLTLGYSYSPDPIKVSLCIFDRSQKIYWGRPKHVEVYKLNDDGTEEKIESEYKAKQGGYDKKSYGYTINNLFFTPEKGALYRVQGKLRWQKKNGKGNKEEKFRMYICVSQPGGIFSPNIVSYKLRVNRTLKCEKTAFNIQYRYPGFKYYVAKNDPNPANFASATLLVDQSPTDDFILRSDEYNENDKYYMYGVFGNGDTYTEVKELNVKIVSEPGPPTYTGNTFICDCNPVLTAEPGEGADNVRWANDFTLFNVVNFGKRTIPVEAGYQDNGRILNIQDPYKAYSATQNKIYLYSFNAVEAGKRCMSEFVEVPIVYTPCVDCSPSFHLTKGEKYVVSAWTKQADNLGKITYDHPEIGLNFYSRSGSTNFSFKPEGEIIDGWQKIEKEFVVPADAESMKISLGCGDDENNECFFDDIRIHRFEGSMVTYVYDPITLQLKAKLDNNNMYIMYSYDEAGNLVGTKVETNDGVRSVNESRTHIQRNITPSN